MGTIVGMLAGSVLLMTAGVWVVGRSWGRRDGMLSALVEEFAGDVMGEIDAQLRMLGPLLAGVCDDDRRRLERAFGSAVHAFYWDRLTVDQFRDRCGGLVREAESLRGWV